MAQTSPMSLDRISHLLSHSPEIADVSANGLPGTRFVSFRDSSPASPSIGLEVCILEVPNKSRTISLVDTRKEGKPTEVFSSLADEKTLGVLNGGFFGVRKDGRLMPLGFLKSGSTVISPIHPWKTGGVFLDSASGPQIVPISRFRDTPEIRTAVQSKPMLVEGGRDGMRKGAPERFDRSAIAIAADGTLLLVVLHEPSGRAASLNEFSQLLLRIQTATKQRIVNALAMDGGPGAHLYVHPTSRHCGSGVPNFIPNALRVTR
jgi:uncharacterized protein YigE (DUF2233 family)